MTVKTWLGEDASLESQDLRPSAMVRDPIDLMSDSVAIRWSGRNAGRKTERILHLYQNIEEGRKQKAALCALATGKTVTTTTCRTLGPSQVTLCDIRIPAGDAEYL